MLYGVIGFSYDNFAHTRRVFARTGVHSANLGDNMQTLAVRHLYRTGAAPDRYGQGHQHRRFCYHPCR